MLLRAFVHSLYRSCGRSACAGLCILAPSAAQELPWAYRALDPSRTPHVGGGGSMSATIDHWIDAALKDAGLHAEPRAQSSELVRRAALDLTGLPPTLEEVRRLEANPSDEAYAALVDQWLSSPAHAEHFSTLWLDAGRYADSNGYQHDGDRYAWPWRDWIVDALHTNRRVDELVVEMIAGDLLPDATQSQRLATSFLRMHPLNNEGGAIAEEVRFGYVVDRVHTVATSFLGLTMACAQCHDHKLDPITQREYYEFFAFFNNLDEDGRVDLNRKNSYHQFQVEQPWLELPQWKELCGGEAPLVMIASERAELRATQVHQRGAYDQPSGEVLEPGIPRALGGWNAEWPKNRLGLARWIVHPSNPLFARVHVNRLWQQIFGRGLVETPEDFGVTGAKPTHPELLDALALQWIESGFDQRALLRSILLSEAYRRRAHTTPELLEHDPRNLLLARSSRTRLSSFALRDQALALAGLLDRAVGGPPVYPYHPVGLWRDVSFDVFGYPETHATDNRRRTIYSFWRRTVAPPALFDSADRLTCVVRTTRTNTPLHSLVLWNDPTYVEAARAFAVRVRNEAEGDAPRIARMWQLATARTPSVREAERLEHVLQRERARYAADPRAAQALLAVGFFRPEVLDAPSEPTMDDVAAVELAAWCSVAQLVLNLDEVLCRP